MADQWSGEITQTTRFGIPQDETQFLKMARDFRSPERLVTTTLRPAVTSSLDSVSNLYTMEDYWTNGKRDEFKTEFERALSEGRPAIDREEISVTGTRSPNRVAPSDDVTVLDTSDVGSNNTVKIVTKKRLDDSGLEIRIAHDFKKYGIVVSSAIVEKLDPDDLFEEKIAERKNAASRSIIAKSQRLEQEEQRLLEITKAEKNIAQRQGQAKVEQIERTTNAETEKRLAVIEAEKVLEQAKISQKTAMTNLERSRLDAEAIKIVADAEAYKKTKLLAADNALTQKLETMRDISRDWAAAYRDRKVPGVVLGGNGSSTGSDGEVQTFMQLLIAKTAKDIEVDMNVSKQETK
jgi:hypothetical protein